MPADHTKKLEQSKPLITEPDKQAFVTIADAALKAGGWQVLEAVNHWKQKIESLNNY